MPNWCSNTTNVFGKKEEVMKFAQPLLDGEASEGFIKYYYPIPDELKDTVANFVNVNNPIPENWVNLVKEGTWTQEVYDQRVAETLANVEIKKANIEKYGYADWYEWCLDSWGTKWGDCETNYEIVDGYGSGTVTLEISYETAWCPASDALRHISTKFPKLIFYTFYREEGMGFAGYHKVHNGNILIDQSADFIPDAQDYEYILEGEDEQELNEMVN